MVTFVCDSGNKYLSKMFNDYWMADQGLQLAGRRSATCATLIARRFDDGGVVSVGPDEPLHVAYTRMRLYDVSQLPVLSREQIVGMIDESDLLLA